MTQWNTVGFEFAAEAAGNSAAFSAASRPSQRTLLVPRVAHASDAQWVSGTRYALEDISAIVQAAVNQPAWAGQALSMIVRGTGNAWARKFISAAEGGAADAPRLVVTYTSGGGGPVNQPPVIHGGERDADVGDGAAGGRTSAARRPIRRGRR